MNTQKYIDKYLKFLKENADPIKAKKEKEYLYSNFKHFGLYSAKRGEFFKKLKDELTALSKANALTLAKTFWKRPSFEEKAFALSILDLHKTELDITDMPLIEKLMREAGGWALLDSLVIPFMPEIIKKDKTAFDYLKKWIKDSNFWVRRSALLAQLLFFRVNENGDKNLFFELAKSQFNESWIDKRYKTNLEKSRARFFVRKAIGWTVREMSAKDSKSSYEFLKKYKNKMSGLSFRDGSRKLPDRYKKLL